MSVVYLARDLKNQRNVAIKVLRPELTKSIGTKRFVREVKIAANLEHPNILPLFDSGDADGLLYYTMPLVEGESLRDRIERDGALPLEDALQIAREVGDALAYAHEQGIVHRDIKPENILLASGKARVADFGIARARSEAGEYESITDANLAIGTPEYMSPEQASGSDALDRRSDIYSLGCVLYAMLAGEPPFSARTPQAIIAKHLGEKVPTLDVVRPGIPLRVANVVEKALAKVPADRFATAAELVAALEGGIEFKPIRPPLITLETVVRVTKRHPVMAVLLLVAILISTSPLLRDLLPFGAAPGFQGRPESVVVLPYHSSTSSEQERTVAVDIANLITRELNSWESIRAVPRVSLAGPMFDLDLVGPTLEFIDDGVELARTLGVQALVTVTVSLEGDSALLDTGVFDAATGRSVERPFHSRGLRNDQQALVAPIVQGILGLSNVPLQMAEIRRATDNPDALMQDMEGLGYHERWRLSEAEQSFRRAIDLDSTFGLAYHHLAQTPYWQAAPHSRQLRTLGVEIQQLTGVALRHVGGLTTRDSMHILAFRSFQRGEYPEARELYNRILRADSTDVYAWLLLGSVEYRDPWLVEDAETGSLLPRGNYNVALEAFESALRLQPAFDLGYGHMFDINRKVRRAVDIVACTGFEEPREELIAHWELTTPQRAIAFCPAALDTIVWIRKAVFDTLNRDDASEGADIVVQRSLALLRRWAEYAPNEAKPHEELAKAVLGQRTRIGIGSPTIIDSLARVAAEHAGLALSLKRDTTPRELARIGSFLNGAGMVDSAAVLNERALAQYAPGRAPMVSTNVLLARGQIARAMDIASTPWTRWFIEDPIADSLLSYQGAETNVARMRMLGIAGVQGAAIDRELEAIEDRWYEPLYSPRQIELLRRDMAFRIALGLAFDLSKMASWVRADQLEHPMWHALLNSESDPSSARRHLESSLQTETLGVSEATRSFLHGLVAQRIGDDLLALQQFSRVDSLPLRLETFDFGWGLRIHSYLLRAEAYEALGDTALALEYYQRFQNAWLTGDELIAPLLRRAELGAARLGRDR